MQCYPARLLATKADEEVKKMTLIHYEKHEDERMEKNAWRVAHDVALRIDDAPALSDCIRAFVTNTMRKHFSSTKTSYRITRKQLKAQSKVYPVTVISPKFTTT